MNTNEVSSDNAARAARAVGRAWAAQLLDDEAFSFGFFNVAAGIRAYGREQRELATVLASGSATFLPDDIGEE